MVAEQEEPMVEEEEPMVAEEEEEQEEQIAASPRARIAQLAASAAATVVAPAACHMWELARASTCRRPLTSMLEPVATSMQSARGGISPASSRRAAC